MFQAPLRRDNVSPFEPDHADPRGHLRQRRTRPRREFWNWAARWSAVPTGLMVSGIRGLPPLKWWAIFFRPWRDAMRTRRSSRYPSSLTGRNADTLGISGLISRRLTFDTIGVGRKMRPISAREAASAALTTAMWRGARPPCPLCPREDPNAGGAPALHEGSAPNRCVRGWQFDFAGPWR